MPSKQLRSKVLALSICLLSILNTTCSKKGSPASQLVCSLLNSSLNQKALTVGLSLELIEHLKSTLTLTQDTDEGLDSKIKETINDGLKKAALSELISIKSVSSVPKAEGKDDGVRFLTLDGSLGSGVSYASTLLSDERFQSFIQSELGLKESSIFSFLENSFNVYAAQPHNLTQVNDSYNQKQWAYEQADMSSIQNLLDTIPDQKDQVLVAVIDTGVSYNHPALQDSFLKEDDTIVAYNFVADNENADDDQGHGTHCAGIIAAKKVEDNGMTGIAELLAPGKVKILPVKVLGANGSGSTDSINKGIRWAMAKGADVISMSLGGGMEFQSLIESNGTESKIIRDAVDAGIIVIVAAGNENCPLGGKCEQKSLLVLSQTIEKYSVLPCSYNGTICIGASDPDTTLASYSNYPSSSKNRGVDPNITSTDNMRQSQDISAPGTAIYSTHLNNSYQLLSGTSMATPFIAGLAAIYKLKMPTEKQANEGSPQRSFRQLLLSSELELTQETSETRSFVGQVGLNYFFNNLKASYDDSEPDDSSSQDPLEKIEQPKDEEKPDSKAPNILNQLCGA